MTTLTVDETSDPSDITPRRVVLITIGVLLPVELDDANTADIVPKALSVTGFADVELVDFIQTRVQEARLVMT